MTTALKQRIVGAIFILSLGVILIPLILDKPQIGQEHEKEMLSHVIPDTPALPDVSEISKIHYVFNDVESKAEKPADPDTNPEQPKPAPVLIPSDLAATDELATPLPPLLAESEASHPLPDAVAPVAHAPESVATPVETKAAEPKASDSKALAAAPAETILTPSPSPAASTPAIPKVASVAPAPTPVSKVHEKASASLAQASKADWTIQLGAFSSEKNAKALVQKLSKGGFNPYLRQMTQDSLVRVYVSPGIPREQAVDLAAKLDTEYGLKGIVVRYFQK